MKKRDWYKEWYDDMCNMSIDMLEHNLMEYIKGGEQGHKGAIVISEIIAEKKQELRDKKIEQILK